MKITFQSIFFICLMGVGFSVQSQSLISDSAVWFYSGPNGGSVPSNSEYYKYSVEKDTSYQGQLAKKISRIHYRYQGDSVSWEPLYLFDWNDSVFYYNDHYQRYLLLYDFSANVGDTLSFYIPDTSLVSATFFSDSTFRIVVDSMLFGTYDNVQLREVYTTQLDGFGYNGIGSASGLSYVEKIGSLDKLLPNSEGGIIERDGPLRCYEDENLSESFSSLACDYRIISSLNEVSKAEKKFELNPNPIRTQATINIEGIEVERMELFDIEGELIKSFSMRSNLLNFSDVSNGVYLLKLTTSNQEQLSKKVVVQK